MKNFLEETKYILEENNKNIVDLEYGIVQNLYKLSEELAYFTIEEFISNSNFEYDSSYGGNVINMGLKLVGKDFWIERHEYDGSGWWEFKQLPTKPDKKLSIINFKE